MFSEVINEYHQCMFLWRNDKNYHQISSEGLTLIWSRKLIPKKGPLYISTSSFQRYMIWSLEYRKEELFEDKKQQLAMPKKISYLKHRKEANFS